MSSDTAMSLKNTACVAMNEKRICVAVSLDIRNVFNSDRLGTCMGSAALVGDATAPAETYWFEFQR